MTHSSRPVGGRSLAALPCPPPCPTPRSTPRPTPSPAGRSPRSPPAPSRDDLAGLAPPIGRLLTARLDAVLDQSAPASRWVDPADEPVAAALAGWRRAAQAAARIPADERDAEVHRAARRALAHLVRPADTLAAVAFEGEAGPLPVAVALDRVRAFGPYPYLPQITERYAERKGLDRIDRAGLERLLRRIDRRMVSTFGPADWTALLEPLMSLVGPVGQPPGSVPADLLRALFQSKGADALRDALDDTDDVDAPTLGALLAETLSPSASEGSGTTRPSLSTDPSEDPAGAEASAGGAATSPVAEEAGSLSPNESVETDAEQPPVSPQPPGDTEGEGLTDVEPGQTPVGPDDLQDGPAPSPAAPETDETFAPPVIGSQYRSPDDSHEDASDVLGPARPVAESPMEAVREAVTEDAPEAPSAPPVPVLDLASPDGDRTAPAEPDASPASPEPAPESDDEPLWMRIARERDARANPTPGPDPAAEPAADDDTPLWKRFAQSDLADRLPETDAAPLAGSPASADEASEPGGLDALESAVLGAEAHERRDWFVDELFGGSADEYHGTLAALARAPTYTDATAVISAEVLRKRRVSPYTDCAVAFIDAVQDHFDRR